jgi:hypothetical protein
MPPSVSGKRAGEAYGQYYGDLSVDTSAPDPPTEEGWRPGSVGWSGITTP